MCYNWWKNLFVHLLVINVFYELALLKACKKAWKRKLCLPKVLYKMEALKWKKQKFHNVRMQTTCLVLTSVSRDCFCHTLMNTAKSFNQSSGNGSLVIKRCVTLRRDYQSCVPRFIVLWLYENTSVYRFTTILELDFSQVLAMFIRGKNKSFT
jgi:hypothetical protein